MKIIFEMDVKERWRKIKNYSAYKVSNFGKIKRVEDSRTSKSGKILKSIFGADGYLNVGLYKDGKEKKFLIHCLVAGAFLGKCHPYCNTFCL